MVFVTVQIDIVEPVYLNEFWLIHNLHQLSSNQIKCSLYNVIIYLKNNCWF